MFVLRRSARNGPYASGSTAYPEIHLAWMSH
jgi:hypothetical protein